MGIVSGEDREHGVVSTGGNAPGQSQQRGLAPTVTEHMMDNIVFRANEILAGHRNWLAKLHLEKRTPLEPSLIAGSVTTTDSIKPSSTKPTPPLVVGTLQLPRSLLTSVPLVPDRSAIPQAALTTPPTPSLYFNSPIPSVISSHSPVGLRSLQRTIKAAQFGAVTTTASALFPITSVVVSRHSSALISSGSISRSSVIFLTISSVQTTGGQIASSSSTSAIETALQSASSAVGSANAALTSAQSSASSAVGSANAALTSAQSSASSAVGSANAALTSAQSSAGAAVKSASEQLNDARGMIP
jgi:hypothetical protein